MMKERCIHRTKILSPSKIYLRKSIRWKECYNCEAFCSIRDNLGLFLPYILSFCNTQKDLNYCVYNFSRILCEIIRPHCIVTG